MNDLYLTRVTLIGNIKENDEEAWREFCVFYWDVITGWARRMGCSDAVAKDVFQETIVSLMRQLPKFDYDLKKGRFRAFLKTIVKRRVYDIYRKEGRYVNPVPEDSEGTDSDIAVFDKIIQKNSKNEITYDSDLIWLDSILKLAIKNVAENMDPTTYLSFKLYVLEERPVEEVINATRIDKIGTVYQHKSRFLSALKKEFYNLIEAGEGENLDISKVGEKDGCTYCAMEYIEGKSLRKLFEENKLSLNDKINYLNKIIFIISKLHEHGFEHRDIKPGNFIIDNKNNVHLLDFGLAKALNKDTNIYTTTYGEFFGTPAYMSPENINSGENPTFDKSSDIYSFGVMAYEILTGKLPYEIEHLNMDEVKYLIQNEKPEPIKKICPNLIHEIANAIDKSLSKNPSVRPTATELLKSFNASENHFNSNSTKYISPVEYSTHSINKKKISKKLLYISAACLIAIAVIIFGLFITYHPTNKEKVISAKILDIKNFTIPTLNIEMIRIPTGNFNMRSMDNQYIFISNSYFISSHEITIGQYLKTPLKLPKNINTDKINQPIRNISWYDAVKFCKLLTAKEKEAGRLPQGYEYRLPTEAEWEYAASAGSKEIYYHGSMPERLSLYAVFNTGEINNIKSKKPNKFGLYDTLGNVWEWCYDSEGEKSILARINPVKKGKRYSNKIIRGGSAAENAENTTLKTRRSISPNTHNTKIGFRIVLGKKLEE